MPTLYASAFRAMGCQVNLWLETDAEAAPLLNKAAARIADIEASLSRFRPESELSRLNARLNTWTPVSETLLANVMAAKQGARISGGLYNPLVLDALEGAGYDRSFDQIGDKVSPASASAPLPKWQAIDIDVAGGQVCLPARIDLGGVAKGWTAQQIAAELGQWGACLVDIGGDMAASSAPSGSSGWPVEVADPAFDGAPLLTLHLASGAVVTSGTDFRRWGPDRAQHHLIDPRTGLPAVTDVATVTIVHPQATTAEVYAKVVVMLGSDAGLEWLNEQWDGAGLVTRTDSAVLASARMNTYLAEGVRS
ncbi:MAG TPA: FAD:protein FMN transferase [Candidatus Limnocylindrales bacterium]|nr:FAD:protein FMN transferase [Candidatus Limnocylindrales bacterium]